MVKTLSTMTEYNKRCLCDENTTELSGGSELENNLRFTISNAPHGWYGAAGKRRALKKLRIHMRNEES